ncbi:MAG: hypothetical protein AAGU76_14465 [Sedimentibacter sp.]|uniref:hypothetical protein n=1 Tax=Sedimentibacter sp. TaxID=1960295 RepID=UPI00315819E3
MFKVLDESYDKVIQSVYLTAMADYEFALDRLVPLIDKLDFQRNPLRKSFYNRLENDIINGCIMPFLTIAIKKDIYNSDFPFYTDEKQLDFFHLLDNAFVLDGIQRLNTLKRVASMPNFDSTRPIFFNILICSSMDRLLYRMVTLNNGQKPMTARHQIEVLANNIFDFNNLPIISVSEKQKTASKKTSDDATMNKENLIKAYIAYISGSVNIDNQKIIESKMDELITDQIMESNITKRDTEYYDIISYVSDCMQDDYLRDWFEVPNNFIGFSAAMSNKFAYIKSISHNKLANSILLFEDAFSSINVSKIKLGMARRRMVKYYFENYEKLSIIDNNKLLDKISMEI